MSSTNGYEYTTRHPGWIQNEFFEKISDEEFRKLFGFYVINTPYDSISCCGKKITEYGWDKDKLETDNDGNLLTYLFWVVELRYEQYFVSANATNQMNRICKNTNLSENFSKCLDCERIAIYTKKGDNIIENLFYHIRNSFAHGRFAIFDDEHKCDCVVVLEDAFSNKENGPLTVRARMVLKKSTLLKWIDIIEAGPNSEEYKQYLQPKKSSKKNNRGEKPKCLNL